MKRILFYSLTISALLFNGCAKNKLPVVEEEQSPVFYAKCNINGIPISLKAGLDDYVMKSSYYLDPNDLYVYKSEFRKKDCSNGCGYELTILINDSKFSDATGSVMYAEESLKVGVYSFGNGSSDPLAYTGKFWPEKEVPGTSYTWSFNDGVLMSGPSITRTFTPDRDYTLLLNKSNSTTNCTISFQNGFRSGKRLNTSINTTLLGDKTYKFYSTAGDSSVYKYFWKFGDGPNSTSTDKNPVHTYSGVGVYEPSLLLVDNKGDSCLVKYQINLYQDCDGNFSSLITPVQNTKALSAITLFVKDQNGGVYSSAASNNQVSDSKFEIVSSEAYSVNDQNQPTRKVKIKFNCTIKDGANTLTITDGEAVIAVAYK